MHRDWMSCCGIICTLIVPELGIRDCDMRSLTSASGKSRQQVTVAQASVGLSLCGGHPVLSQPLGLVCSAADEVGQC